MRRRDVLVGAGGIASVALAGCTGNDGDDGDDDAAPPEAAVRFFVTNEDDVQRSISIDVQVDGDRQASGQGTLPPADEQTDPFRYGFPSIGVPVSAVIQSDNASRTVQWDPEECTELNVEVTIIDGEPEIEESCQ